MREAELGDAQDASGIIAVLDSYASDPVGGGVPLSAAVRTTLIDKLRQRANVLVMLAIDDTQCVGIAICFFGLSTFAAEPLLNIHDLAVLPTHRGRGIGRALLEAAERRAREDGCCKLTLEVQDGNHRARGLYRSFGFGDLVFGDSGPTRFLTKPLSG